MDDILQDKHLWLRTLGRSEDNVNIEKLKAAFISFRARSELLVQNIGAELPGLTIHDITHLDALWRVANEIIGENYPLNPAEAFVLGASFLLHDSAHVLVAYPEGLDSIRKTTYWQDLTFQRFNGIEPETGSDDEKSLIFEVIRSLHASQARNLINQSWKEKLTQSELFLLEDFELRNYYGEVIGEIAESHHWDPQKVAESFKDKILAAPGFFSDTSWTVDVMKIALILRTADAAHIDSSRTPWFSSALKKPVGISETHWRFQSKIGQVFRDNSGRLNITSGSKFDEHERDAWWMAFDTANMINNELKFANNILLEEGRQAFSSTSVIGIESPYLFSKYVSVKGWEPIDISPKISQIPKLIEVLGGKALYGDNYYVVIRELVQNGFDSIFAARKLGYLENNEGHIEINLEKRDESWCITISDTGIGMSKFVLTNVLLDFGTSLWNSGKLTTELPGLAKSGFQSSGKFGIGFYSVFMLSNDIIITTNRFRKYSDDNSQHWKMKFSKGLSSRPVLTIPQENEELRRHGTAISFLISQDKMIDLLKPIIKAKDNDDISINSGQETISDCFDSLISWIFPTSPISIKYTSPSSKSKTIISSNDWISISDEELKDRLFIEDVPLVSIKDSNGEIKGRLGLPYLYSTLKSTLGAVITYNGIRSGELKGVVGVCLSNENNSDAARKSGTAKISISDWVEWAEEVIEIPKYQNSLNLLKVHPLIPHADLRLWTRDDDRFTLAELKDWVNSVGEFSYHIGDIHYDTMDLVREADFDDDFIIDDDIIIIPKSSVYRRIGFGLQEYFNELGINEISYPHLFSKFLSDNWEGRMKVTKNADKRVGFVNDVEIFRSVTTVELI